MIVEVEDQFCRVARALSEVLSKLQRAAERGDAVHEVEETTWSGLIEMGREMIVGYIKKQEEDVPRSTVIEYEGKKLPRLPRRRRRPYVSAFGPTPFWRDVYAERETQRQEVGPLAVGIRHAPAAVGVSRHTERGDRLGKSVSCSHATSRRPGSTPEQR